MSLGERLKTLRTKGGVTVAELTRVTGLSDALVGMIERGTRGDRISAETAIALARALGCSEKWLVLGEGTEPDADTVRAAVAVAAARAAATLTRDDAPTAAHRGAA